ncbi:hypothetical protein [Flagellimonas sp.]|uniref:hypothetical protein n=1 Tax=Flagellimonas sp. TaxID=2058762 RepID=UPI003AB7BE60
MFILVSFSFTSKAQQLPKIISDRDTIQTHYLPDFSFAGYHNGERSLPKLQGLVLQAEEHGVTANDGKDDSRALVQLMDSVKSLDQAVTIQLPKGRIILSEVLYLERGNLVLRGHGSGPGGTEIYCPRPMLYFNQPPALKELREYLEILDKRQREPKNNIDLPFSQYSWSGGLLWTQVPGERVKSYLEDYDREEPILARALEGEIGGTVLKIKDIHGLKTGDVVELQWFNTEGEHGQIIKDLYPLEGLKVGSHHWNFPNLPLVRQQVEILAVTDSTLTLKSPLTMAVKPYHNARVIPWKHLKEVGIEHLRFSFPEASYIAHHVERGFNAIYLTRLYNSWVKDVVIDNADSGILTEEIANVTIKDIVTIGQSTAHYSVSMSGVHNVLVENLSIHNKVVHPLSFNTFATKSVYKDCEVFVDPILDQHSGANHQNLFDHIKVHLSPDEQNTYPLFEGGGASYWKPTHGPFSTFWNIYIHLLERPGPLTPVSLYGMKDGPLARIVGIQCDQPVTVDYGPSCYIEGINSELTIPSLYTFQLQKRLGTPMIKK